MGDVPGGRRTPLTAVTTSGSDLLQEELTRRVEEKQVDDAEICTRREDLSPDNGAKGTIVVVDAIKNHVEISHRIRPDSIR
jgi:hypothetical protein